LSPHSLYGDSTGTYWIGIWQPYIPHGEHFQYVYLGGGVFEEQIVSLVATCGRLATETECLRNPACTWDIEKSNPCFPANNPVWSNFDDWYAENSSGGYSTPSPFATSLITIIQPIFENTMSFLNGTLSYFFDNNWYDNGLELGTNLTTYGGYITKIDFLFGGFPLTKFFTFCIVILISGFVIRMVLKFIPFFG
jgi:hypothetical protein